MHLTSTMLQGGQHIVLVMNPYEEKDEEAVQMQPRWMAVARYYSGKSYSTWGMFSELSSIWGKKAPIPVRELGGNRFLVEFDSEWLWKRVLGGGPWRHKGDAVIFVPYDGIQCLSEVAINSIPLWVRIYDIFVLGVVALGTTSESVQMRNL